MRILVSWDSESQIDLLKMYLGVGDHAEFGISGLQQTMQDTRTKPAQVCLDRLFADSYAFTQGFGRHGDTSVLVLESE